MGTGVYSGEYLVATKTIARDFTVTGGLGWGRLASVGGVENPFCSISDGFCTRDDDFGRGGNVELDALFHGEKMGFFGGVEWRTPIDKLTLKAEVSSDAYTREQQGPEADFERKSPINVGAEYRLTAGHHAGRLLHVRLDRGLQRRGLRQPVSAADAAEPRHRPGSDQPAPGGRQLQHRLGERPRGAGEADRCDRRGAQRRRDHAPGDELHRRTRWTCASSTARSARMPKAIGRTAAVLAAAMPYSVEQFSITPVQNGLPTTTVTVDRSDLEAQVNRPNAGATSCRDRPVRRRVPGPRIGAYLAARRLPALQLGGHPACRPCSSSAATTGSGRS